MKLLTTARRVVASAPRAVARAEARYLCVAPAELDQDKFSDDLGSVLAREIAYEVGNTEEAKLQSEAASTFPDWNVDVQPGTNMLILKKKFQDEEIEVEINACQPQALDAMEEGEESDEEERPAAKEVISVTVHVRKPEEPNMLVISAGVTLEQLPVFELVNVQVAPTGCTDAQLVEGGYYEGPEFHELDPSLQSAWETWLYDRGFDETFTEAVADLADMKESSEYLHWLRAAHKFVGGPAVPEVEFRE